MDPDQLRDDGSHRNGWSQEEIDLAMSCYEGFSLAVRLIDISTGGQFKLWEKIQKLAATEMILAVSLDAPLDGPDGVIARSRIQRFRSDRKSAIRIVAASNGLGINCEEAIRNSEDSIRKSLEDSD